MNLSLERQRELIKQVYCPPQTSQKWTMEELVGHPNILCFSLGRFALLEALKITGIEPGDIVLVPGFICRDLLASINMLGARPEFYPVMEDLTLACDLGSLPAAKAVIAVNYFGFPQYLRPFADYCETAGAVLIEDNAHGLFSRDESGQLLGTRGDIGIFSLRKTVSMPDGAAMVINNLRYESKPIVSTEIHNMGEPPSFRVKQALRKIVPAVGPAPLQWVTSVVRGVRKIRTGQELPAPDPNAEKTIPGSIEPCAKLHDYLESTDVGMEVSRRRELYLLVDKLLMDHDCRPVFKHLPDNTVPYLYPFYAKNDGISSIRKHLSKVGLDCFPWPELPDAIAPSAPEYYRQVWGVSFLW
ncbi:MAG: DegT/DnrJ/EryC1/StrS family aminotransferase [Acidobacteriota bacterium]